MINKIMLKSLKNNTKFVSQIFNDIELSEFFKTNNLCCGSCAYIKDDMFFDLLENYKYKLSITTNESDFHQCLFVLSDFEVNFEPFSEASILFREYCAKKLGVQYVSASYEFITKTFVQQCKFFEEKIGELEIQKSKFISLTEDHIQNLLKIATKDKEPAMDFETNI